MGPFNRGGGRSSGGFNRGGFGGGRPSFGGGSRFGGGERRERPTMHKATCSECGNDCEIPFRPTGERPVFCSSCFEKQGGGGERRPSFGGGNRFGGDRRERPRTDDRPLHDATCSKCGKECQVPFQPSIGKSVFCNDCFERGGSKNPGEVLDQVKKLNEKIDKLIKILAPNASFKKVEETEVKVEKAEKKTAPKKVKKEKKK